MVNKENEWLGNWKIAARPEGGPIKIALIQPVASSSYEIKKILVEAGYDVTEYTMPEALFDEREEKTSRFDLFIIDYYLPDMDLFEAIRRLKSRMGYMDIPVIVTAYRSNRQIIIDLMEEGADHFLLKPIDKNVLLARVEKILSFQTLEKLKFAPEIFCLNINNLLQFEITRAKKGEYAFSILQLFRYKLDIEGMDPSREINGDTFLNLCYQKINGKVGELIISTGYTLLILLLFADEKETKEKATNIKEILGETMTKHPEHYLQLGYATFPQHGDKALELLAQTIKSKQSLSHI